VEPELCMYSNVSKDAFEMASGGMIFIPSFIKIGSDIQKLLKGIHMRIHRQQGDLISLLLFFRNKKSGLRMRKRVKQDLKSWT
jgi:hypothetical protein